MTILERKVFISSNPRIVLSSCPPPCGHFSIQESATGGLSYKLKKMCGIAGTFGAFQAIMPMTGWLCVHTIVEYFRTFEKFIPWIALILLGYIGGSMLINGIRGTDEGDEIPGVGPKALFVQGIATSIDALSVGFTISEYDWLMALVCSLIIAIVTFFICMTGLSLGKRFGTRLSNKADILGGVILIAIGLEIFISNMF